MQKKVLPGHTLSTHGTLAPSTQLIVYGGTASQTGGVVLVTGNAENFGQAILEGSGGPGIQAATATIETSGILTNAGRIDVYNGTFTAGSTGAGASLTIDGQLDNPGFIFLGDGYTAGSAMLTIASGGVLTNSGVIDVVGARYAAGPGLVASGTLINSGLLTNTGSLTLFGGYSGTDGAAPARCSNRPASWTTT